MGCGDFWKRSDRGRSLMFLGKALRECKMQNAECKKRRKAKLRLIFFAFCILHFAFLTACRQKMAVQPRYDPLEPSDFFADHMGARPRVAGTVARGEAAIGGFLATGKEAADRHLPARDGA